MNQNNQDMYYNNPGDNYTQFENARYVGKPVDPSPSMNVNYGPSPDINASEKSERFIDGFQKFRVNKPWICSIMGLCRLTLLILFLGGWIAAALALRNDRESKKGDLDGFKSTRIAYLVFAIWGYIYSIFLFLLYASNCINAFSSIFEKMPIKPICIGIDVFFILTMLSVSIACAAREYQLSTYDDWVYEAYLIGAFATAASFGFLICIILAITIANQFMSKETDQSNA